ncbi:MAG: type II toxin-antitoxin system RelE/ParE family toxin [Deltaproteobacteria bacterium]|nr:type II toxin-antitoxin system RelE/ParE family toxin [Deltaproteobacteria bacterium]
MEDAEDTGGFYQEDNGEVPLLDWLAEIPKKALVKCRLKIARLHELGHELHRLEADYLRDEIYELRVSLQGLHYRLLYFFHGSVAAVVSHGLVKEQKVPPKDIELARKRKTRFEQNPRQHTYEEPA